MTRRIFLTAVSAAMVLGLSAQKAESALVRYEVNDVYFNEAEFFGPALEKLLSGGYPFEEADEGGTDISGELLDYARGFLGTRYRRAGKTPKGFDCSGFTGYVFRKFGYRLGSSSSAQGTQGEVVANVLDARPGDLIFFNGSRVGSRIGHVGIVMNVDPATGRVTFIHSSIQKGVTVDYYPDDYYYGRRFVGIRRVLKD